MKKYLSAVLLACFIMMSGCKTPYIFQNSLEKDITLLRKQMKDVQVGQADVTESMDSLDRNMGHLEGSLDDTQERMSLLAQRMDDIESNLIQRMDILNKKLSPAGSGGDLIEPPPSDLFSIAESDYRKGKYDLAISEFRAYMDKYPKSELSGDALYYIGESYFAKGKYEIAIAQYDKLQENYKHNRNLPNAKFKKGLALLEMDNKSYAKKVFEYVIKKFPDSPEAKQSEEKLNSISP